MKRTLTKFAFLPVTIAIVASATAQLRVVNFNVAGLDGDLNALQDVFSAIATDDKPGFAVAPHLIIMQEVQSADTSQPSVATSPLTTRINAAFPGVTYVRATFTSASGEDSASGAQCVYYRSDTLTEIGHIDIVNTGGGRNTDRWQFRLNGYTSSAATFYVYSSHLKASQGFESDRLAGVTLIRNNADALPAGTHIIYAGDYNMYTVTEPAYAELTSAGNGQANDPYGAGEWTGAGNALKHTQSPCNTGCVLVSGGMDDRFDIQLASSAFVDGEGFSRISGTYRPFGNDGNHYNLDINAGNNTYYPTNIPRSNALAADLKIASDHLPLICEYQVPAKMQGSLTASFGRVIQGASVNVSLQVANTALALVTSGADELDYSATAGGVLSGTAAGTVGALASPAAHSFAVNTSTVGAASGTVNLSTSSQGAEPPSQMVVTSGNIVRHSNPSFSTSSDLNADSQYWILAANAGIVPLPAIDVFNFGFDANQALLDVDSVSGLMAPFQFDGGLAGGIGGGFASLLMSVDTATGTPQLLNATVTINTSDENIPGASNASLTFEWQVRLRTILGDINDDCEVNLLDLTSMLGTFGSCAGDGNYLRDADLDNNGCIELDDLTTMLGDFGHLCD